MIGSLMMRVSVVLLLIGLIGLPFVIQAIGDWENQTQNAITAVNRAAGSRPTSGTALLAAGAKLQRGLQRLADAAPKAPDSGILGGVESLGIGLDQFVLGSRSPANIAAALNASSRPTTAPLTSNDEPP